jgi:hypothetical protein
MKDTHVIEVRKARQKHAAAHGNDLHAICEDLRRRERSLSQDRLVTLTPVAPHRVEHPTRVAEDQVAYGGTVQKRGK